MGILRTDKISGLETPTAVTGSVVFDGTNDILSIGAIGNWNFLHNGLSDWTVEFWGKSGTATRQFVWGTGGSSALRGFHFHIMSSSSGGADAQGIYAQVSSGSAGNYRYWGADDCLLLDTWHHIAAVFKSSDKTLAIYVDGREVDNDTGTENGTFSYSSNPSSHPLLMGENPHVNGDDLNGEISNLRVVNGRRLYTSNFTPPIHALEPIDGTVVLCCNNPDSVTASSNAGIGTAHIITTSGDPTVGTDYPGLTRDFTFGTQFEGVSRFDTQGYFVPPSGTTEQRGRGRGVFGGGYAPGNINTIAYIEIQTQGNALDFGDLSATARRGPGCVTNSTRAVWMGGVTTPLLTNIMDFVTIATTGNAVDFGDAQNERRNFGSVASNTRGVFGNGINPAQNAILDFITIGSLGTTTTFGDSSENRGGTTGSACSPTRGLFAGGYTPGSSDTIDFITIATTGNAQDFGNLTIASRHMGGASSSTRGVFSGGNGPANENFIDFVTIATTGNAQDFGDLTQARENIASASNSLRGVFYGGVATPTQRNTIDFVTISTTGNALDFGDAIVTTQQAAGGGDSHGGIS